VMKSSGWNFDGGWIRVQGMRCARSLGLELKSDGGIWLYSMFWVGSVMGYHSHVAPLDGGIVLYR
jgi:hypothetical protein